MNKYENHVDEWREEENRRKWGVCMEMTAQELSDEIAWHQRMFELTGKPGYLETKDEAENELRRLNRENDGV